ncbi:MAG TPA: carboxypeptidase regulatory-like domain-containing protein [Polyangiaceae bacterium]|nr:carboxypeptidase regulatory-like domain-containing protein [Polyangiaceae bacterium]
MLGALSRAAKRVLGLVGAWLGRALSALGASFGRMLAPLGRLLARMVGPFGARASRALGPWRGPLGRAGRRLAALWADVGPALAALACLLFVATLTDSVPLELAPPDPVVPPAPDDVPHDGSLAVEVVDEAGKPVAGASVRAYLVRDEVAYEAGKATTDGAGAARLGALVRGELWVVAEAPGRQRASSHVLSLGDAHALRMTLRPSGGLVVRVSDDRGKPLAGARVSVRGGDPLPFGAATGADGLVTIGRLGPPPWSVEASMAGYESARRSSVVPGPSPLAFELRPLGQIAVAVRNPDGTPAPGAAVMVAGSGLWPARRLEADAEGRANVAGLTAGVYDLMAQRGDEVSSTLIAEPLGRGETKSVELVLGPGRRVSVRTVDGPGEGAGPVRGAAVVAAEEGVSSFPREGTTGENGVVTLGPFAPGPVSVSARAEGFVASAAAAVPPDAPGPFVVALVRAATLRGEVVDKGGYPVQGAFVEVVGTDLGGMPIVETPERAGFRAAHFAWTSPGPAALIPAGELGVMPGPLPHIPPPGPTTVVPPELRRRGPPPPEPWVSGDDGRFKAAPVPPGRLRALVRHPLYVEALSDAVDVGPGGEATVKVVLRGGGSIEGRVVDSSRRPVGGARVEMASTYGSLVRSVTSADDGTFAFAAVPGDVTLALSRPGAPWEVVLRKPLSVREGERKEVTLVLPAPRGPVSFRVFDENRRAIDGVQLGVVSLDPDVPLRRTLFSAADGTATLDDAEGLPLRVTASAPGRAPLDRTIERAAREEPLVLVRGAAVEGEVRARGGRDPVEGAEVTLTARVGVYRGRTDAEGAYHFRDVPPGPARLAVTHAGHAPRELEIEVPEPVRDRASRLARVVLEEGGSVEGRVLDARGDPVVGARVAAGAVPAYTPAGALPRGVVATDAEGRFRLDDLPPGEVALEAYLPSKGRGRDEAVPVRAGRVTSRVTLRLRAGDVPSEPAAMAGLAVTLGEQWAQGQLEVQVLHVAPGSEAERAGVRPGDEIAAVDGKAPDSLEAARRALSGPEGSDVVVRLRRGGDELTVRVGRERLRH